MVTKFSRLERLLRNVGVGSYMDGLHFGRFRMTLLSLSRGRFNGDQRTFARPDGKVSLDGFVRMNVGYSRCADIVCFVTAQLKC